MDTKVNEKKLFIASCLALVVNAMAFSIRADIIPAFKLEFGLTDTQIGLAIGPGLWGFTITIVLGGFLLDLLGMKTLLGLAFLGHVSGIIITILARDHRMLYFGTLLIGLASGAVEAVINPLIVTLFPNSKTRYLNILHAWWPGGLIAGGVCAYALTKVMGLDLGDTSLEEIKLGWRIKMAFMLVPTLIYGLLVIRQKFPKTERVNAGISYRGMLREIFRPLFLLFCFLMLLTAATELGPDQWVGNLLMNLVGIQGILLLIYTAGIMFILRQFFASRMLKLFSPTGLLIFSSILSFVGLFLLGHSNTVLTILVGSTVFGIGKTYFWPTMLGEVAERFPKGGALLLSIMGGVGMFSAGYLTTPIMGAIQDHYAIEYLSPIAREQVTNKSGIDDRKVLTLTDEKMKEEVATAKKYSAAMTLRWVSVLPAILTIVFTFLYMAFRRLMKVQKVPADFM